MTQGFWRASTWLWCVASVATLTLCLQTGCQDQSKSNADNNREANEPTAPFEAKKAGVGVGKSSQALEKHGTTGDVVAGPAKVLFRTKEKIVFEIQIPQALNLYKAEHGKGPQSHEEFMEKIIRANRIQLPKLPPGQRYEFNVEKQELWVVPDEQAENT